jgi:RHS repeat-associated protein
MMYKNFGRSSYITNAEGIVSQHMEYLPFGELLVDEHKNSYNSPFKYNGKEFDAETGNYYYGARYYDPKWSIFVGVDPLAEQTFDSYGYCYNNPINLIDPTGMAGEGADHIIVTKGEKEGTYVVTGGEANEDRGIYLDDGNGGKGEKVGTMMTTHSFFDENDNVVEKAIIDMNSTDGQDFLDKVIKDNPYLPVYMWYARNGKKYDFKAKGIKDREAGQTELQYKYRGSVNSDGEVGSARDFGNFAAGLVAARRGLSWQEARLGFDMYQGYKSNGIQFISAGGKPIPMVTPVSEAPTTIKAQMTGFLIGSQQYKR